MHKFIDDMYTGIVIVSGIIVAIITALLIGIAIVSIFTAYPWVWWIVAFFVVSYILGRIANNA